MAVNSHIYQQSRAIQAWDGPKEGFRFVVCCLFLRHGALLAYTTENSSLCQLAYGIVFVKHERSPDILQMTKILLFLR